jgi:hypothetical protein
MKLLLRQCFLMENNIVAACNVYLSFCLLRTHNEQLEFDILCTDHKHVHALHIKYCLQVNDFKHGDCEVLRLY